MSIDFDTPRVAAALEALQPEQIDALPFGVVRLTPSGMVIGFSNTEARLSGFDPQRAFGRHFFDAVAPCMNTPGFRGQIEAEAKRGSLDLELGHTGDFDDPARMLRVRVCSASDGGLWLLLER